MAPPGAKVSVLAEFFESRHAPSNFGLSGVLSSNATFSILLGQGNRNLDKAIKLFQGSKPAHPILVRWDADPLLDLVFSHEDCIAWRKGRGDAHFEQHECIDTKGVPLGIMNYDSNERADLVVRQDDKLVVWEAGEKGWITARHTLLEGITGRFYHSLYDVDRDGNNEVYLVSSTAGGPIIQAINGSNQPCILGEAAYWNRGTYSLRATDTNNDKVVDFVSSRSCAGCTSNHVLHTGRQ
jgi:hypothetical protein